MKGAVPFKLPFAGNGSGMPCGVMGYPSPLSESPPPPPPPEGPAGRPEYGSPHG
jgi:hypothetical protein